MELNIKLKNTIGLVDEKDLFITGDKLTLNFHTDYALTDYLVSFGDGAEKTQIRVKGEKSVVVPKKFFKAGLLFVEVRLIAKANVTKTFICEPIALKELDGDLYCIKAYDDLKQDINKANCNFELILQQIKKLSTRIDRIEKQVKDLWENEEK